MTADRSISLRAPGALFIDGQWIEPATPATFDVVDPATEERFISVAAANADDMDRAIAAARRAFDDGPWPRLPVAERAELLRALADGLRARSADIAIGQTREMGVLHAFAGFSAGAAAATYDSYAAMADDFSFAERRTTSSGATLALLVRDPVGVVGAIVPWNSPVSLAAYKVAPALLAGCTVVLKSSPEAPSAGYVLAEVAEDVGLPPGVLNCVTADRDVSEGMVLDARVDKIAFTGSAAAGRRIASLCGARMARYTLELGGKSPGIVLDDYDVDDAARALAASAPRMTGQTCASLTRIIVRRTRHDDFVDALSDRFARIRVGDPFDPSSEMGPLATARQRARVEGYIQAGVDEGAHLAVGGRRPEHLGRGFYIEPTLFARVDNASTIAREEIFGPVLSVIPADDEQDAIRIANDTEYGLNAVVFTKDPEKAVATARAMRTGTVGHNTTMYDFEIGFGGFKQSGVGREGGREGLLPYLENKTVLLGSEQVPVDASW
jgi:acyl-CoA reductase-like NAD-dependent aldehyde dehydrogenase